MKTFDHSNFTKQLSLSRHADCVASEFAELDKLVKFALQHCESANDFSALFDEVHFVNNRIVKFIEYNICNEHTEDIEHSTDYPTDN